MPDIKELASSLIQFRRDIHLNPELGFQEHRTAAIIANKLRSYGIEVHENIGETGVVGVLKNGNSTRTLGLRADIDALPITEETNLPWASRNLGCFHGCGHDGHLSMLLGAAEYLANNKGFDGTINFIFQPAEEGMGGAKKMIEDGLFERFPCDRIYGLHNWPQLPVGTIATRAGAIMGAADKFHIKVVGHGGHAAQPHKSVDTINAAANLVLQINTIISRDIAANANAVISVTQIKGGFTHNVLPSEVYVGGTIRTFDAEVQDKIEARFKEILKGIEYSFGVTTNLDYDRYYPATINDAKAAEDALSVASQVGNAYLAPEPAATSEDFSFMLQKVKGAYLWLGQGKADGTSPPLHNPHYDFNDDVMAIGIKLHVALAQNWLKP